MQNTVCGGVQVAWEKILQEIKNKIIKNITRIIPILKSLRLGKRSPLITPSCLKREQIKNNAPLFVKPKLMTVVCFKSS